MTERFFSPVIKYTTTTLKTLPGAKLYFYENNTTTPKSTWADPDRTTENSHPVTALSDGTFPPIFINGSYRVELKSAAGVTQTGWPVDDVGAPTVGSPFADWSSTYTYSEGDIVVYNGEIYISDDDDNLGNIPSSSPASWTHKLLIDAPSAESYLNGNSDGTYDWRTIAQTKTDLSLPTDTATELINRATSIDNISDLRLARTATNGQKFNVTSYNSGWAASGKPPVGGGMFTYVSTDTTSAEDYGHIIVGADGKRYYRDGVDCVNVQHFGAKGDGVNDNTAIERAVAKFQSYSTTSIGQSYAGAGQLNLYFPEGHYLHTTGYTINYTGFGQVVYGDGVNSRLDKILVNINQGGCELRDVYLTGAGDYGVRIDGTLAIPNSAFPRNCRITSIKVYGRSYGIKLNGNNANTIITNSHFIGNTVDGMYSDYTLDTTIGECYFLSNTRYGVHLQDVIGGEFRFNNCVIASNFDKGMVINSTGAAQVNESYFNHCTITINQQTVANRDSFSITSAASNGAGGTTLTIGSHNMAEGLLGITVSGTTSYNGTHTITNVTNTTVDIPVAYVSSQTGTLYRPEWDLYIKADVAVGDVMDQWFTACNINYTYIEKGYNINFENCRLKQQFYLTGGSNRIFRVGNLRGRGGVGNQTYNDIPTTGQNVGFTELIYSQNNSSKNTGSGGIVMRMPDSSVSLVGNMVQRYNSVQCDGTSIAMLGGGRSASLTLNGFTADAYVSYRTGTVVDNTVHSFTPPFAAGKCIFTNGSGQPAREVTFTYSTTAPTCSATGYQGSVMNLMTGALTGTSGVNGKITLSAHTDGKIYMECWNTGNQGGYFTFFR